jgi:Protein of unknown function (DUF2752)
VPAVCPTARFLHVPCPSCGLTRAARAALHGDFAGATHLHPLWWAVLPPLALLVALEAVSYVKTGSFGRWTGHPVTARVTTVLIALLVVLWGARAFGAFGGPVSVD